MMVGAFSCTKPEETLRTESEVPEQEQCQAFDMTTISGHLYQAYSYKDLTTTMYSILYLKFNSGIVIDTVRVSVPKNQITSIAYNRICYPSTF